MEATSLASHSKIQNDRSYQRSAVRGAALALVAGCFPDERET
jgi:hypothetical protein